MLKPCAVLVPVIHELLNTERFATFPDLIETVKCRCARLHIPYDAGAISAALDVVSRTRPLLRDPAGAEMTRRAVAAPARTAGPLITRAEAAGLLARVRRVLLEMR